MISVNLLNCDSNKIEVVNEFSDNIIVFIYQKKYKVVENEKDKKKHIKKLISKITTNIPLFDIIKQNIYLIKSHNVYLKVTYSNFRLPDKNIFKLIKNS